MAPRFARLQQLLSVRQHPAPAQSAQHSHFCPRVL